MQDWLLEESLVQQLCRPRALIRLLGVVNEAHADVVETQRPKALRGPLRLSSGCVGDPLPASRPQGALQHDSTFMW
eukprot:11210301-Lingulodinium_polyedra.AAC.1